MDYRESQYNAYQNSLSDELEYCPKCGHRLTYFIIRNESICEKSFGGCGWSSDKDDEDFDLSRESDEQPDENLSPEHPCGHF